RQPLRPGKLDVNSSSWLLRSLWGKLKTCPCSRTGLETCPTTESSCQNLLHDPAMHISQAEVASLEAGRQPGVVQAQQVQDRGLNVVDMHGILHDVEPLLVSRPAGQARFETAADHEYRIRERVMVTVQVVAGSDAASLRLAAQGNQSTRFGIRLPR